MVQRPSRPGAAVQPPARPARPAPAAPPPTPPAPPARPRAATRVARAPRIPPHLFGIDKAEAPPAAWLKDLFDVSNLRFTGAYIDGPPLTGNPAASFTIPSRAYSSRHWMDRVDNAWQTGWGIVFFYLGYSSPNDGSADHSVHPPAGEPTPERGRLHAQHIKSIIHDANPGWAGAVVMIDNENSEGLDLDNSAEVRLRDYYLAMCEELTTPGPGDAPPMRPGFYLHGPVARPLLRARPDLFVWDVEIDVADRGTSTTLQPPFSPAHPSRIEVGEPHTTVSMRAVVVPPTRGSSQPPVNAWPVGRQFRFFTGSMPRRGSPVTRVRPSLTPIATFDFDCALVRNPAFPVAEPRVVAFGGREDAHVMRGSFAEPSRGGASETLPSMDLRLLSRRVQGPHPTSSPAIAVEPDAPLVGIPPERPETLYSQSRAGVPLEWRLQAGAWTMNVVPSTSGLRARRVRALAAAQQADRSVYLFTVTTEHRLYAQRRTATGTWSDPAPMAGDMRLHPFTALSSTVRGDTVEVIFLNREMRLSNAWWSPRITSFPGTAHMEVEQTQTLLPGGALSTLAPTQDHLLVLGIGRDLRLHLADFRQGRGWQPPSPLGRPEDRLTPHARIGAHMVTPTLAEVCALSHDLRLLVYQLRLVNGTWQTEPPQPLPAIPPTAPAGFRPPDPTSPVEPAFGWALNPFGDISLGRTAGGRSYVVVSAVTRARAGAVARFLDGNDDWWLYR